MLGTQLPVEDGESSLEPAGKEDQPPVGAGPQIRGPRGCLNLGSVLAAAVRKSIMRKPANWGKVYWPELASGPAHQTQPRQLPKSPQCPPPRHTCRDPGSLLSVAQKSKSDKHKVPCHLPKDTWDSRCYLSLVLTDADVKVDVPRWEISVLFLLMKILVMFFTVSVLNNLNYGTK